MRATTIFLIMILAGVLLIISTPLTGSGPRLGDYQIAPQIALRPDLCALGICALDGLNIVQRVPWRV